MNQLSPSAQAVLKAAEDAYLRNDNEFYNVVNNVAAAALRAAADHVYHDWSGFNCVDYLCEIAAELEGSK